MTIKNTNLKRTTGHEVPRWFVVVKRDGSRKIVTKGGLVKSMGLFPERG